MKVVTKKLTRSQQGALIASIGNLNEIEANKCELLMAMYFLRKIFERLKTAHMGLTISYKLSLDAHEAAAFYVCFHTLEVKEEDWGSVIACEICMMIAQALQLNVISASHMDQSYTVDEDGEKQLLITKDDMLNSSF